MAYLVIWCHSREGKTLYYSRVNMVMLLKVFDLVLPKLNFSLRW